MFVILFLYLIVKANGQQLPTLPREYGITVEANILHKNRTFHMTEVHSESIGFSRFHFTSSDATIIEIFDFNLKIRHEIYQKKGFSDLNCSTLPIDAESRFAHQRNFTETFQFGGAFSEEYQGVAVIRGIVADHWTHRFQNAEFGPPGVSSDFVQDFFWSTGTRQVDGRDEAGPIPLQSIVKGTFNGTQFENTYSFGNYFEGTPPVWARNALFGNCQVQETISTLDADHLRRHGDLTPDNVPKLPIVPRDFSLVVEANIGSKNKTFHLFETHSESLGLSRIQFRNEGTDIIEIFDFNEKVRHEIVQKDAIAPVNCTTIPLDEASAFGHQRNFSEIFDFGGAFQELYVGRRQVRGIWCDHWIHRFKSGEGVPFSQQLPADIEYDFTQDFFFSVNGWVSDGNPTNPFPVRSIVSGTFNGTDMHNTYNFLSFQAGNPPLFERAFLFGSCDVQRVIGSGRQDMEAPCAPSTSPFVFLLIGLAVGLIVGALVVYVIQRKRNVQMA